MDERMFVAIYGPWAPGDAWTPRLMTAADIAKTLEHAHYGDDVPEFQVYHVDEATGDLLPVTIFTDPSPYDENDWGDMKVELYVGRDVLVGVSGYRVDGRA